METTMQTKTTLSRPEAAEYIGISLRILDERTANGEILRVKIGRSVRYRVSALDNFIEANEAPAQPIRRRVKG